MDARLVLLVAVVALFGHVAGHGRLEEPPSRASAWRFGFKTPVNTQDNELFCGGFSNQVNQGYKCGVCGDPYQGPRQHEAGGKYATGTIVRRYDVGSRMAVRVDLTANHKGWMEFRLCPNNDPKKAVTHECLDKYLLTIHDTEQTRYQVVSSMKIINVELELPQGLTCSQCVLQWKYHAGNNWGTDPKTGKGCVGCGPQEEFYGCSDVAIGGEKHQTPPRVARTTPSRRKTTPPMRKTTPPMRKTTPPRRMTTPPMRKTTPPMRTTRRPKRMTTPPMRKTTPPMRKTTPPRRKTTPPRRKTTPAEVLPPGWCGLECCAVGVWRKIQSMDNWCVINCVRGYCPPTHCICL